MNFFSTVNGKALGRLVRICGIIKLINIVCTIADKCHEIDHLQDDEFVTFFENQLIDKVIYKVIKPHFLFY